MFGFFSNRNASTFAILLLFACTSTAFACNTQEESRKKLHNDLEELVRKADAQVGIALIGPEGDSLCIGNSDDYPLMSVFKFHQAVGLSYLFHARGIRLDTMIRVYSSDLRPGTWSPLRENYPHTDTILSLDELLSYSLQLSDNNASNLLFNRFQSPFELDSLLRALHCRNFRIRYTEADMSAQPGRSYENRTSPYAAASLLKDFLDGKIGKEPYRKSILKLLTECSTGEHRLRAGIKDTDIVFGHKTGSGFIFSDGRISATNDLGFFQFPDKRTYVLAVFIKDSRLSQSETESIIARISKRVFLYFKKSGKTESNS